MKRRLIKIGEASEILGVSVATLRKWEISGELLPTRKTQGGTRYYDAVELLGFWDADLPTICYARVSRFDQKAELDRQHKLLEAYCASKGWNTEVIRDLGSGMNFSNKGLRRLLEIILKKQTKRLVITHKERLLRFGAELIFTLCELQGIEIIIIHQGEQPAFEQELAEDIVALITILSARLCGAKSKKNRKLIERLQAEADRIGEEFGIYDGLQAKDYAQSKLSKS